MIDSIVAINIHNIHSISAICEPSGKLKITIGALTIGILPLAGSVPGVPSLYKFIARTINEFGHIEIPDFINLKAHTYVEISQSSTLHAQINTYSTPTPAPWSVLTLKFDETSLVFFGNIKTRDSASAYKATLLLFQTIEAACAQMPSAA